MGSSQQKPETLLEKSNRSIFKHLSKLTGILFPYSLSYTRLQPHFGMTRTMSANNTVPHAWPPQKKERDTMGLKGRQIWGAFLTCFNSISNAYGFRGNFGSRRTPILMGSTLAVAYWSPLMPGTGVFLRERVVLVWEALFLWKLIFSENWKITNFIWKCIPSEN
jgi:hypothetical protein